MVQNMTSNEHGSANTRAGLIGSDKELLLAEKGIPLRDSLAGERVVLRKALADERPITNATRFSGTKRPVRNTHGNIDNDAHVPQMKQCSKGKDEIAQQQTQMHAPKVSWLLPSAPIPASSMDAPKVSWLLPSAPIPASSMDASSGVASMALSRGNSVKLIDLNQPPDAPDYPLAPEMVPVNRQKASEEYFTERFFRLQARLRECDNPNRDEYNKFRLRSSSSTYRSRVATELEEIANRLAQEESIELQRMKDLNIFGLSSSKNNGGSSAEVPK